MKGLCLFFCCLVFIPLLVIGKTKSQIVNNISVLVGGNGFASNSKNQIPDNSKTYGYTEYLTLQFDTFINTYFDIMNGVQIGKTTYKAQSIKNKDFREEGDGLSFEYQFGFKFTPEFARWINLQLGLGLNVNDYLYKVFNTKEGLTYSGSKTPVLLNTFIGVGFLIPIKKRLSLQINALYHYYFDFSYAKSHMIDINIGVSYRL